MIITENLELVLGFLTKKGAIKEGSFVGDAVGRIKDTNFQKDHGDSDRKFADNIGITFILLKFISF